MIGSTHLLLGMAAAVPAAGWSGQSWLIVAGMVGGLWPDLDLSETTLANWRLVLVPKSRGKQAVYIRPFAWLGALADLTGSQHRGWWHSLPAALLFGGIFTGLFGGWFGLAFIGGYLSHLLGDAATVSGVEIWPGHHWHLLPAKWRLKTGAPIEHLISSLAAIIVLAYLLPTLMTGLVG